jgi:NADH-quinone oxidoreductase subunit K
VLVYVGAVMVLFLFVVMMLDINLDAVREGFWKYLPVGAGGGGGDAGWRWSLIGWCARDFGLEGDAAAPPRRRRPTATPRSWHARCTPTTCYPFELAAVILLVAIIAAVALTLRKSQGTKHQDPSAVARCAAPGSRAHGVRCPPKMKAETPAAGGKGRAGGERLTLGHFLILGAILFAISVAGIFLNRKNVIVLLMAIELMLLAVNMNFVAFSHYLGDIAGPGLRVLHPHRGRGRIAIGLAILVVLFRNRARSTSDDLDTLKG